MLKICRKTRIIRFACILFILNQSAQIINTVDSLKPDLSRRLLRLNPKNNANEIKNHLNFISSGNIYLINNQKVSLDTVLIRKFARDIKRILRIPHMRTNIKFVDDNEMKKLYKFYFEKDKSGDIISVRIMPREYPRMEHCSKNGSFEKKYSSKHFDSVKFLHDSTEDYLRNVLFRGNIYVCPEYIIKQSNFSPSDMDNPKNQLAGVAKFVKATKDISRKVVYLLIHGMLHLMGYDHVKDEDFEKMLKMEEYVIGKLNMF